MALDPEKIRFVARPDRKGWGIRAAFATALSLPLGVLAVMSMQNGAQLATVTALAGTLAFAAAAAHAAVRFVTGRSPLKIDAAGLEVGSLGPNGWRVAWSRIAAVKVERVLLRRRVVLVVLDGRESPRYRALPVECHADLPPEWLAGLIETFRSRGGPFKNL